MPEFRIAANLIPGFAWVGWGHLQLVLANGASQRELEVQAPEGLPLTWQFPPERNHKTNTPFYEDPGNYGYVTVNLGSRRPEDVWSIVRQVRDAFELSTSQIPLMGCSKILTPLRILFYIQSRKTFLNTPAAY